jgi:putative autotransporter adhesin-like protein
MTARGRLALAAVAAVALGAAGCGGGAPVRQHRTVASFRSLELSDGVDVRVVRAAAPTVTVAAGDEVVDRVVTEVSGGVLHVGVRDRGLVIGDDPLRHARVEVGVPRLDDVRVDGATDADLSGIAARTLTLHVSGPGDLTARGRVGRLSAEISGPGDAKLRGLAARTGRVVVSGPGDAEVDVRDRLAIEVNGPGDVTYHGTPAVTQRVRGPGDVRHQP